MANQTIITLHEAASIESTAPWLTNGPKSVADVAQRETQSAENHNKTFENLLQFYGDCVNVSKTQLVKMSERAKQELENEFDSRPHPRPRSEFDDAWLKEFSKGANFESNEEEGTSRGPSPQITNLVAEFLSRATWNTGKIWQWISKLNDLGGEWSDMVECWHGVRRLSILSSRNKHLHEHVDPLVRSLAEKSFGIIFCALERPIQTAEWGELKRDMSAARNAFPALAQAFERLDDETCLSKIGRTIHTLVDLHDTRTSGSMEDSRRFHSQIHAVQGLFYMNKTSSLAKAMKKLDRIVDWLLVDGPDVWEVIESDSEDENADEDEDESHEDKEQPQLKRKRGEDSESEI